MLPSADVRPLLFFFGLHAAVLCSGKKTESNIPDRMLQRLELRRVDLI